MGSCFKHDGTYRFVYTDHSGCVTIVGVDATDDAAAITFAREAHRDMAVEVWRKREQIVKLPPTRDEIERAVATSGLTPGPSRPASAAQ